MNAKRKVTTLYLSLIFLIFGCATIPPEAPDLSIELGKRISAIETANLTLLHRYFDHKRNQVDQFIEKEWVPVLAEKFFSNPKIDQAWNEIVRTNNRKERLKFIILVGPRLQDQINRKRLELIKPLDDLERHIGNALRAEYAQASAMNNSITSFLISASKVTETRDRYLEMIGVKEEKIGKVIDKIDDAVSDLLKGAESVQKKADAAEKYINKIKDIIKSI